MTFFPDNNSSIKSYSKTSTKLVPPNDPNVSTSDNPALQTKPPENDDAYGSAPGRGSSYMASSADILANKMESLAKTINPYGPLPPELQEFFTSNFPSLKAFMNERKNFSIYEGEVAFKGKREKIENINLYPSSIERDGQLRRSSIAFLPHIEDLKIAKNNKGEKVLIIAGNNRPPAK